MRHLDRVTILLNKKELETFIDSYLQRLNLEQDDEANSERVLKEIEAQHGILVERAYQIYSFAHLTFQEYFTARYIVENRDEGTLQTLMVHIDEDRWREVFLLVSSSLSKADVFFELFIAALRRMIHQQATIQDMLVWANGKTTYITADADKMTAYRSYFIYFALNLANVRSRAPARARDLARDLANVRTLDHARDLDHTLDHARDLAHTLDRYLVFARARDRAPARARDLARDLARARDLVFARAPDLAHALDLARVSALDLAPALDLARVSALDPARDLDKLKKIMSIIESVQKSLPNLIMAAFEPSSPIEWRLDYCLMQGAYGGVTVAAAYSEQLGLATLHRELKALLQLYKDRKVDYGEFMERKLALAQTHRGLKSDWQLSEADIECWNRYLKGTQLLLDCLEGAAVTDRVAIKGQLLMV